MFSKSRGCELLMPDLHHSERWCPSLQHVLCSFNSKRHACIRSLCWHNWSGATIPGALGNTAPQLWSLHPSSALPRTLGFCSSQNFVSAPSSSIAMDSSSTMPLIVFCLTEELWRGPVAQRDLIKKTANETTFLNFNGYSNNNFKISAI